MKAMLRTVFFLLLTVSLIGLSGCESIWGLILPKEDLPDDPVQRAAILGLYNAYNESAMWEIKEAKVLRVQPMIPTRAFVREHDPKEVYCVCIEYKARYKVPWAEKDRSPWEDTVRNILVIKTQGDHHLAFRPSGICPSICR